MAQGVKTYKIKLASRFQEDAHIIHLIIIQYFEPIWTYCIQSWDSASISNLNIIQRLLSKIRRLIFNAPYYVRDDVIHNDTKILTIIEDVKSYSFKYSRPTLYSEVGKTRFIIKQRTVFNR